MRDIGPDLRPDYYRKKAENEGSTDGEKGTTKEKEPSTLEDLGMNIDYGFLLIGECVALLHEL